MQSAPFTFDGDYVVFPNGRHLLRVRGAEGDPPPPDDGEKTVTLTQAELDRKIEDRLARQKAQLLKDLPSKAEIDALKQKAEQWDAAEEAGKDDLERVSGERDSLKSERDTTAAENLRLRVALQKKVPAELIDRLRGDTKEDLEADADQLLDLVKSPAPGPGLDGGSRDPAPPPDDQQVAPGLPRLAHAYAQADNSK